MKTQIQTLLLFIMASFGLHAQSNLHEGLKEMIDLEKEGYVRKIKVVKLSTKTEKQTECTGTVYQNALVCSCGSSTRRFYPMYEGRAYKTDKGKIVEVAENDKYIVIFATSQTHYYIKKQDK